MATNKFGWPAKPDNPVLNRAHPLVNKLILDVNYVSRGGNSEQERVTGIGTAATGTTIGMSNSGPVRIFPGGTATDVDVVTNRGLFTDPNRITLECVVLLNTGGGNGLGRIVDGPFFLNYQDSNGGFNFFQSGWGAGPSQSFSGFSPPTGTWFHLVMVYDSSTLLNLPHFYINGVLQTDGGFNTQPSGTPPADSFGNPVLIGNNAASGGARSLNGQISYVRMWNRILSYGEIKQLYANPWQIYELPDLYSHSDLSGPSTGTPLLSGGGSMPYRPKPPLPQISWDRRLARGLVLDVNYYNLGGSNQELVNGLLGTPVSITPVMSPFGPARSWPAITSASDTYVTPASVNNLTKITTELMILPTGDTTAGGGAFTRPFTKGGSTPYFQIQWGDVGSGGDCTITTNWTGGVAEWETISPNTGIFKIGVWNHVVVTYDYGSTTNAPALYVNGQVVPISMNSSPSGAPVADTSNLTIGNRSAGDRNVQGAISHFRMWNRTLSPTEINLLYSDPWQIYSSPQKTVFAFAGKSYLLAALQGAFVETGNAVVFGVRMPAGQGGFVETGEVVTLVHGKVLAAAFGSFVETGEAALFGIRMPAAQGSFALTGEAANLVWSSAGGHFALPGAFGPFVLAGEAAALKVARKFGASNGLFDLTGEAVSLVHGKVLGIARGLYALTGEPVAIHVALSIKAQCGTLALTGGAAVLARSGWVAAVPNSTDWMPQSPGASGWSPATSGTTFWTSKQ